MPPAAFTVSNLKIAGDIKDVRRQFELFEFNPAETALVSQEDMARIGRTSFAKGVAKIQKYDTDCIVIDAEFRNGPGFLVLADQDFPGWKAFVDGRETPIYRVDGLLRGVVVPLGRHAVEFKYHPEKAQSLALSFAYQGGLYLFTLSVGLPFLVASQAKWAPGGKFLKYEQVVKRNEDSLSHR